MTHEYYAVVRSTDHLEHYGVKGMKWGVRKAIATGNSKALDRHFRKAAKKLVKLTDIGLNSKKYAAKAAAYGAAAAGTGTLAIKGSKGIGESLIGLGQSIPFDKSSVTNVLRSGKRRQRLQDTGWTLKKNNSVIRIGSGLAALGLGAAAARNAYRAVNGKKYRARAVEFRNAMDNAFAGTKYSGQYVAPKRTRKRKRK